MTNFYSPFYSHIGGSMASGNKDVGAISSCGEFFKQFLWVDIVPLSKAQADAWSTSLSVIGFRGHRYYFSRNWYEDEIHTVDEYWSRRPKKLVNTVRRKKRSLNRDSSFSIQIFSPSDLEDITPLLADFHNVYFHSWKQPEPYPQFIDAVMESSTSTQSCRIGICYYKGIPVAAQVWFIWKKTAFIFKLAHRKEYSKESVGTVLMAAMVEHVVEVDEVTEIDFLTGNDEYKDEWMSKSRVLFGLRLYNINMLTGRAKHFIQQTYLGARNFVHSVGDGKRSDIY